MKFDIIIIGAGESGINKAMEKLSEGKRVAVVSAGRSTIAIRHAAEDIMNYDARLREGTERERLMRKAFRDAGGILLEGDEAVTGLLDTDSTPLRVVGVETRKLQDDILMADEYYLATGTFVSRGLRSNYLGISEPVFNLDVIAPATPAEWINDDFFAEQPFLDSHVATDEHGHALKGGTPIENLYPIGSIAGANK